MMMMMKTVAIVTADVITLSHYIASLVVLQALARFRKRKLYGMEKME